MKIDGPRNDELINQEVIDELESEGLLITINTEERLFTVQIPPQVPRDLLVSLVLRLKRAVNEDFKEDYFVTQGPGGEVIIRTHFTSSRYREVG